MTLRARRLQPEQLPLPFNGHAARHTITSLTTHHQIDPTWKDRMRCADAPNALMTTETERHITVARATCAVCPVWQDCLTAQHRTHPRHRIVGVVAGLWWDWDGQQKRIIPTSPENLPGWCPLCSKAMPPGRPATIHVQRCVTRWTEQRLDQIRGDSTSLSSVASSPVARGPVPTPVAVATPRRTRSSQAVPQ